MSKLELPTTDISLVAEALQTLATRAPELTSDDEIYEAVRTAVVAVFPADRVAIMEVRQPRLEDRLNASFQWGEPIDMSIVSNPALKPKRASWSLKHQTVINFLDGMGNPVDQSFFDSGFRQAVVTPVVIDQSNMFSLNVFSKREDAFRDSDLAAIKAIGGILGLMLAGSKLRLEAQWRAREAELLAETGRLLGESARPSEMVEEVSRHLASAFACTILAFVYADSSWTPWAYSESATWRSWGSPLIQKLMAHIPAKIAFEGETRLNQRKTVDPMVDQIENLARSVSPWTMARTVRYDDNAVWMLIAIRHEETSINGRSEFTANDQDLFAKVVDYVTPFWINANLNEEMGRTLNERDAMRRLTELLNQTTDLTSRLTVTLRTAQLLFGADFISLQLIDDERIRTLFQGGHLPTPASNGEQVTPAPDEVVPLANRDMDILDIRTPHDLEGRPLHAAEQLRSSMVVPLTFASGERGSLLFAFRNHHWFAFAEVRFGRQLAETISNSIRLDETLK